MDEKLKEEFIKVIEICCEDYKELTSKMSFVDQVISKGGFKDAETDKILSFYIAIGRKDFYKDKTT